jgi:hypothetical protein
MTLLWLAFASVDIAAIGNWPFDGFQLVRDRLGWKHPAKIGFVEIGKVIHCSFCERLRAPVSSRHAKRTALQRKETGIICTIRAAINEHVERGPGEESPVRRIAIRVRARIMRAIYPQESVRL